jgi:hypothetical protein
MKYYGLLIEAGLVSPGFGKRNTIVLLKTEIFVVGQGTQHSW